ncbi:MAG: hypothetical protein JNN13_15130 [Planctomycetes bacterium]|nr:hypothetical protein [Planctomycetota bacterium]MBZ0150089.1 hypothetical protein [Planctomycetota bacterium]MCC7397838.1 hypothetical protein [Planctomycetota bacterium]
MELEPDSYRSEIEGLRLEARPEWLAGRYWWRVFLNGHSKVLLRHREHAIRVGEILADDEVLLRREQRQT